MSAFVIVSDPTTGSLHSTSRAEASPSIVILRTAAITREAYHAKAPSTIRASG
jgi:hypothetical protein